ncbi:crotonase/enoyl-CoA hydratase family protein [Noviherbaspirillum suwonense]|uniref:Methylglutaconyl-CoA hydratase n=1 Tax=Noviherbaspirillum suwonense TaxID=1224511 RepID=A0ABY1QPQ2_9BURK|nr:crotonase/enoyl-CoA hydratase family protein [Noviherbaspirillum suwonense]SMP76595.1 methylglutaconyl-CoA hydratase [Noviherbaspirillum suwonense]
MNLPEFETLLLEIDARGVARLTLNRSDTHNALNATLISELCVAVDWLGNAQGVHAVVLTGAGKTFCAGGDLGWMQENMKKSRAERVSESADLARMLRAMNDLPMPLIGRINGSAYGGGVGMISVCDISIAADTGVYSLTEVRLGLLPANIAPYVVARMGEANARRTFLTARRMSAPEAQRLGLVSDVVAADQLDAAIERELADLLQCAPGAVAATKKLVAYVHAHDLDTNMIYAADKLADAWETEEGREGIAAFFGRRLPAWRQACAAK